MAMRNHLLLDGQPVAPLTEPQLVGGRVTKPEYIANGVLQMVVDVLRYAATEDNDNADFAWQALKLLTASGR